MKHDRVLVFLAVLLAVALSGYLAWWEPGSGEEQKVVPVEMEQEPARAPFGIDAHSDQSAYDLTDSLPRSDVYESAKLSSDEASQLTEILRVPWRVVTESDVADSPIRLDARIDVAEPVVFDPQRLMQARAGDQVALQLPDGTRYVMRVTGTEVLAGNQSVSGMVVPDNALGEYPVMFTVGKNSAFATITTPNGSFSLETVGGKGWLYANPSADDLGGTQNDQLFPGTSPSVP